MPELKDMPTLHDLQQHIKAVCAEKGWDKNSVTEIYLLFSEETGELAREMYREKHQINQTREWK